MRRLIAASLLLLGCREPAHITVGLRMQCQNLLGAPTGMAPALPTSCESMQLDCANFLDVRLYESQQGHPGNILRSRCLSLAQIQPRPQTMCDLQHLAGRVPLLDDLPDGHEVMFRVRALYVLQAQNGCNDDLPGQLPPVLLFDGFSGAVPIDGDSHTADVAVNTCGNCRDLPPATMCTPAASCRPMPCPHGTTPTVFPGDPNCCVSGCKNCDPAVDPGCIMPATCPPTCPPPQRCPDGSMPIPVPGFCCPVCPNQPPSGS
jgi:hypothetical protein